MGRQVEALRAKRPPEIAKTTDQQGPEIEQADFLGVADTGQDPAQVPGMPVRRRLFALPAVDAAGIREPHGRRGKHGSQKDDRHGPVEQQEQSGYRQQGDPVLANLRQIVDEVGGTVGSLPLGPMERVVIPRALVVLQVGIDGLLVKHAVDDGPAPGALPDVAHRPHELHGALYRQPGR